MSRHRAVRNLDLDGDSYYPISTRADGPVDYLDDDNVDDDAYDDEVQRDSPRIQADGSRRTFC